MKLKGVSWRGFGVPFCRQYVTSTTSAPVRYGLLLFVHEASGRVGVGEASPVGPGSLREIEMTAGLLEGVAPRLIQADFDVPEGLASLADLGVPPALRFGLEAALLDLEGKVQGRTVADLLGGCSIPLPVNALIAEETPQGAAARAKEAVTLGFTTLKLKIAHGTPAQDEALISEVRRVVGPSVKLRVDANEGWSPSQAIEAIRRLAAYDLEYVEQPVAAGDVAGLAKVRRAVPVPIAADEALHSIDCLRHVLAADVDLLVIKAGLAGGIHNTLEMIRMADQSGKPVVITSALESGVGIAASAHLAATLPSHPFAHGLSTGLLLESCLVSPPLLPACGMLPALTGPGLGVDVDMEDVAKYSIDITGSVGSLPAYFHKC
ncbi:MAG: o-succinylbenzoate synthase [Chloroflexi bacterium]|nr:o-succinylbenzoate synthase [Chloroflexota bacterium]